jgi:hypothetical protein
MLLNGIAEPVRNGQSAMSGSVPRIRSYDSDYWDRWTHKFTFIGFSYPLSELVFSVQFPDRPVNMDAIRPVSSLNRWKAVAPSASLGTLQIILGLKTSSYFDDARTLPNRFKP